MMLELVFVFYSIGIIERKQYKKKEGPLMLLSTLGVGSCFRYRRPCF